MIPLVAEDITYGKLAGLVFKGTTIKTTRQPDSFSYDDYNQQYAGRALPLCALDPNNALVMFTTSQELKPKAE